MPQMQDLVSTVCRFQLFGFGLRRKLVYQAGMLRDALSGEILHKWNVRTEKFAPSEYRVDLDTEAESVAILEDEQGVWLERGGDRQSLTRHPVRLPVFSGPHAALLRSLHAELLVNVMPWGPVPNLWFYPRPWYRDAAMMALCFEHTGNVEQIAAWIDGVPLHPYDFNNRGNAETDNLGQVLMLASLTSGTKHPIVERALREAEKMRRAKALTGSTDFAEHPVYQTKWLKYGLRRLSLDDPYEIPSVPDSYSALFWMDFKDSHQAHPRFGADTLAKYPYLNWAEAHFYGDPPPEAVSAEQFPLTRELQSSEANYGRMRIVAPEWVERRQCSPHTWHAAEMFLYLIDQTIPQIPPHVSPIPRP